jgi:hypothetical protein
MDTIGFDCHAGVRSKGSLLYQHLEIAWDKCSTSLDCHVLDLTKPVGETIVLVFEMGERPPSTGGKTQ